MLGAERSVPEPKGSSRSGDLDAVCLFGSDSSVPKPKDSSMSKEPPRQGPPSRTEEPPPEEPKEKSPKRYKEKKLSEEMKERLAEAATIEEVTEFGKGDQGG